MEFGEKHFTKKAAPRVMSIQNIFQPWMPFWRQPSWAFGWTEDMKFDEIIGKGDGKAFWELLCDYRWNGMEFNEVV